LSGRAEKRKKMKQILIPLLILALWFSLQMWILPKLGIST